MSPGSTAARPGDAAVPSELVAAFAATFGRPPEVAWRAPGRVNLIGEYMDLNESFVLPIAIHRTTVTLAARRPDRSLWARALHGGVSGGSTPIELKLDSAELPTGWAAYPGAVAMALQASGYAVPGADLLVDGDVPVGAGLSSSAALECSVAGALCTLAGTELPALEVAKVARRAENEFVGVPCGIMDQAASMCCQRDHALLLDTRDLSLRQVPFDLEPAGLALLVVDTRVKHELGESAYARRWEACQLAARTLGVRALRDVPPERAADCLALLGGAWDGEVQKRARHVFSEQARVLRVVELLEAGRPQEIGRELFAAHGSLRDDFEVSCAELDAVVEAAAGAGAIGARMTGAGFGGSAIVLADRSRLGPIEAEVRSLFARRGFRPPDCFPVTAAAGAYRAL